MNDVKEIVVDGQSELLDRTSLLYKEFPSDYRMIRYFTLLIVQSAPAEIKEINLLEQQISEIIKNAVKHGNKSDPEKVVRVWYRFTEDLARLIVEDQGDGFQNLEEWNQFNRNRLACLHEGDFERLGDYVSFKTLTSDDQDGGNALFAALEYWNGGFVYSEKKNCVGMLKVFPRRRHGVVIEE